MDHVKPEKSQVWPLTLITIQSVDCLNTRPDSILGFQWTTCLHFSKFDKIAHTVTCKKVGPFFVCLLIPHCIKVDIITEQNFPLNILSDIPHAHTFFFSFFLFLFCMLLKSLKDGQAQILSWHDCLLTDSRLYICH